MRRHCFAHHFANTYLTAAERCRSALGWRLSGSDRMSGKLVSFPCAIRSVSSTSRLRLWLWWVWQALLLVVDQLTSHLQVISAQTWEDLFNQPLPLHFKDLDTRFPDFCRSFCASRQMGSLFVGALALLLIIPQRIPPDSITGSRCPFDWPLAYTCQWCW